MNTKKILECGNEWQKETMHRVYVDPMQLFGKINYYNSGNISSATFDGRSISNAEAYRIKNGKWYYDFKDDKFHAKGKSNEEEEILAKLNSYFKEENNG